MEKEIDEVVRTIDPVDASYLEEKFVARIELLENGCWQWHGTFDKPRPPFTKKRSPVFWTGLKRNTGKLVRAYAYAYETRVGELPDLSKFAFVNKCGHDLCANPYHYDLITRQKLVVEVAKSVSAMHAKNRIIVFCKEGHPESEANTYRYSVKGEQRVRCLICQKAKGKEIYRKRKANDLAKAKAKAEAEAK
jgi:hypothetical protein